ncbi:MAG: hypothetical protein ABSB70_04875 [Candidatus Velthaea sp.]|jgi:predicted Zn-ribbon and HTH transcriptional regulator
MWNFQTQVFSGAEAIEWHQSNLSPSHLRAVLDAINDGFSRLPLPRLSCRECGLNYGNTGTFLSESPCPACRAEADD